MAAPRAIGSIVFGSMVQRTRVLTRLISGDGERPTRFHDATGESIDARGMLHAPKALAQTLMRIVFNHYPSVPWIPYRASSSLSKLLQKEWNVHEFGSGMSTIWLAERVGSLTSVEADPEWHRRVSGMLEKRHFSNVEYFLRQHDDYADMSQHNDASLDLVVVDGRLREDCLLNALVKVRPGGFVYLDNSDRASDKPALDILQRAVRENHGELTHFIDFAPGSFFVTRGSLARL